jgi:hypothetical protein
MNLQEVAKAIHYRKSKLLQNCRHLKGKEMEALLSLAYKF